VPLDPAALAADAVFLRVPEAASAEVAPALLERGMRVIDLSGAFRLKDDGKRAKF
jgi:N-acetyl-gamma-glutamyl-phosphate reductase